LTVLPGGCSFQPVLWLQTTTVKRYQRMGSTTVLIWGVLPVAEQTFRRLNAPELLPSMYAGMQYISWSWKYRVIQLEIAA
jgi:hypothetical protein